MQRRDWILIFFGVHDQYIGLPRNARRMTSEYLTPLFYKLLSYCTFSEFKKSFTSFDQSWEMYYIEQCFMVEIMLGKR